MQAGRARDTNFLLECGDPYLCKAEEAVKQIQSRRIHTAVRHLLPIVECLQIKHVIKSQITIQLNCTEINIYMYMF